MTYQIKVAQFQGPFDLILFFIERDELDIYDIPIFKLTNDFLEYIREMQKLNIDLASEFILVAATLMRIKVKTLLPRKEVDEQGEAIDPRAELVAKLLEYKKFKEVVGDLQRLADEREMMFVRGKTVDEAAGIYDSFETEMDLESINLYKLVKVFNKVLVKMNNRELNENVEHRVVVYPYTVRNQKKMLHTLATNNDELHFTEVFESCHERMEAIFRFLALLEMIQLGMLKFRLGIGFNNFWIDKGENLDDFLKSNADTDAYDVKIEEEN